VIRVLPRLKTLDGDHITSLDKELAEEFAVRGGSSNGSSGGGKRGSRSAFSDARPMTAPVRGGLATRSSLGSSSNGTTWAFVA
jgi:hypothetical protein